MSGSNIEPVILWNLMKIVKNYLCLDNKLKIVEQSVVMRLGYVAF